ncbi:MAG: C-terminal target protein [Flavipsychrobacter sp.]|nr:C-terminal target protein [Flavipsychrobacter sp.]
MRSLTFTCLLFMNMAPATPFAQPIVTANEFYATGEVISMVASEPSGLSAGAPGAALTWNFSAMVPLGGFYTTTIMPDTSLVFITANQMHALPGNKYLHVQANHTDSYIHGVYDAGTNVTTHYNNYNISKRPFTYNSTYIDTYQATIPPATMHGTGVLTVTGDAYGTLILPNGTFNNVLRIKKYQVERDTTGSAVVVTTNVSYMWFDSLHNAPLLQIDSTISVAGSSQRAMYLASPVAVQQLNAGQDGYTAYLTDNELLLRNNFEQGRVYEVTLYNMIGGKLVTQTFVATGNSQRIDISKTINPGIYIVSVQVKDVPGTHQVIRVVKQ